MIFAPRSPVLSCFEAVLAHDRDARILPLCVLREHLGSVQPDARRVGASHWPRGRALAARARTAELGHAVTRSAADYTNSCPFAPQPVPGAALPSLRFGAVVIARAAASASD